MSEEERKWDKKWDETLTSPESIAYQEKVYAKLQDDIATGNVKNYFTDDDIEELFQQRKDSDMSEDITQDPEYIRGYENGMKDRKEVEEKSKAPYMQGWMAAKYSEMQEIQASSERRKSILERIENKEPTLILDPYKHGRELAIRTINREKDRQETKYRQGFHDTYQEMIHQKIETEEVDDEGPIDILAKIVEDIRYIHERLAMLEKYTQE